MKSLRFVLVLWSPLIFAVRLPVLFSVCRLFLNMIMKKSLLDHFQEWFSLNDLELRANEICVVLSKPSETNKSAQFAGIDVKEHMARITLWITGECDMEVLEVETGTQVFWQHREIASSTELNDVLREFVQQLSCSPRNIML